jgi:hypothetical protein
MNEYKELAKQRYIQHTSSQFYDKYNSACQRLREWQEERLIREGFSPHQVASLVQKQWRPEISHTLTPEEEELIGPRYVYRYYNEQGLSCSLDLRNESLRTHSMHPEWLLQTFQHRWQQVHPWHGAYLSSRWMWKQTCTVLHEQSRWNTGIWYIVLSADDWNKFIHEHEHQEKHQPYLCVRIRQESAGRETSALIANPDLQLFGNNPDTIGLCPSLALWLGVHEQEWVQIALQQLPLSLEEQDGVSVEMKYLRGCVPTEEEMTRILSHIMVINVGQTIHVQEADYEITRLWNSSYHPVQSLNVLNRSIRINIL